ncbi:GspE/PulE family protein [Aquabacterium sp.]|uniref:GspE/PulE family protein n=1 Tax=Aquabacterium sp. TaxID=1872578 RepID=UPI0037851FA0
MSDLSLPPLVSTRGLPFAWPTPPYASFASPQVQREAEPCEIEGPNGRVTRGQLVRFDADTGIAHLLVPPARGTLPLKLAQVRRLTLLRPLAPLEHAAPGSAADLLGAAVASPCRLRYANGGEAQIETLGQVEHALGHFLFPPADDSGAVLRSFYPREALAGVEIGPRVGELLLAQQAVSVDTLDAVAAEQQGLRQRRLGDILLTQRIVAPEQLVEAIEQQARMPMVRIGEALLALGFIDEAELGDALQQQTQDRKLPLGELLVQRGVVTRDDLQTALARKMGYPVVDAGEFPVENEAALRLPQAVARRLPALPLMMRGGRLVVALEDPSARMLIDEIEFNAQAKVVPVLARAGTLAPAIERVYQRLGFDALPPTAELAAAANDHEPESANQLLASLELQLAGEPARDDGPVIEQSDNSLVRLINTMILEAQQAGVSDIHIECPPAPEKVRIRFRRDGRLKPYLELPPGYRTALVARLKIMCDLDISERRKPQDGKISFGRFMQGQTLELRVRFVDAGEFPVENEAALRLPQAVARRLPALPLMMRGGRLVVALEDPSARMLIDEIEFNAQAKVVPVLARAGTLAPAIERVYQRLGFDALQPTAELAAAANDHEPESANQLLASLELQLAGEPARDDGPVIEQSDNSLVRLINTMILEAQQAGVSDIHIECPPAPEKVRIRFRRDGRLKPYLELPPGYRTALVARLKIMCDLDISERRKPQDGKISFGRFMQGQTLELRVATIPTANNHEDVVLRLLASARALPLDDMGLAPAVLRALKEVVERPYGLVLCVGPTGSGKTTTLHAALAHINTPERKIWTAEDPVEITQKGLRQVQVNPRIDWTFAKALRAFLRADPDVVMVGEIRDPETAQMAVEASLTGHLVLSTLHTNSATETVTRLLDMGLDPFGFADSLLAVLAQRLVRRLCRHCVSTRPATEAEVDALLDDWLSGFGDAPGRPAREATLADWRHRHGRHGVLQHHAARGCRHCADTGFNGRLGLHELLLVNREMRHLIQTHARSAELQQAAVAEGLRTLRQDGIEKVLAGLTTIEEVRATSNA